MGNSNPSDQVERMKNEKNVNALIKALKHSYYEVRIAAAKALREISDVSAVEPLIQTLKDHFVREYAIEALLNIGEPAVEPLIQALKDQNWQIRGGAAYTLGKIGDSRAVEPLIQAQKDEHSDVRTYAVGALKEIGESALVPLIQVLKDENFHIRIGAASVLGSIGDIKAVDPLIQTLKDEYEYIRATAASSLGKIGDVRAVDPLIQALKEDKSSWVRRAVACALGEIGDERAVEPLSQALRDKDWKVGEVVSKVLLKFGRASVELLIQALKDEMEDVRKIAAETLGEIKDTRAYEPLIQALKDNNNIVRRNAARALIDMGDERAVEPLSQALKDKDSDVRRYAVEALEKVGNEKAISQLVHTLKDEFFHIREKVIRALAKIGEPAVEPLIQALKYDDWHIRWGAARALGEIKDKRAVEPLEQALKDIKGEVRMEAAMSLGKIVKERAIKSLDQAIKNKIGMDTFERLKLIEKIMLHEADNIHFRDHWEGYGVNLHEDLQKFNPIEYERIRKETDDFKHVSLWDYKDPHELYLDAIDELYNYLKSDDKKVRLEAMRIFTKAQSKARHQEADPDVGLWGVLNELSTDKYWNLFVDAMGEEDLEIQKAAKSAVMSFKTSAKFPKLYYLLNNWNPHIRRGVREALLDAIYIVLYDEMFSFDEFVSYIIEAAGQEDDDLRNEIASEIERLERQFPEIYIEKLASSNEWIREFSARELRYQDFWKNGQFDEAVDALIKTLGDSSPKVRYEAAETLGELGDRRAVEPLTQVLKDKDKQVQEAAQEALQKIDSKKTEN